MSLVFSVIIAIAVMVLVSIAIRALDKEAGLAKELFGSKETEEEKIWIRVGALPLGIVVGAVAYLAVVAPPGVALMLMLVIVVVMAYLCYWWKHEGTDVKEMIPFILLLALAWFPMKAAAATASKLCGENNLLASIVLILPMLCGIAAIGAILWSYFTYYKDEYYAPQKNYTKSQAEYAYGKSQMHRWLRVGAVVVTVLALSLVTISGLDFAKSDMAKNAGVDNVYGAEGDQVGSIKLKTWEGIVFYHDDVVDDGDDENDWDFGKSPYKKGKGAKYYQRDFANKILKDPAKLSGTLVAYDGTLGTPYLGEVSAVGYDEKYTYLDRGNTAIRIMSKAENKPIFDDTSSVIYDLIMSADKVKLKKKDITNYLCMTDLTIDGVPSLVYYSVDIKDANVLALYYNMKGEDTAEIDFCIDCDYQWCNCESKMDVRPAAKPSGVGSHKASKKTKSHGSKPGKKPGGTGDNTGGTPQYNKSPSKAPSTNTEPNDDKGPGPDTNNPSDPQHSRVDTPDSSTSGSYQDYKDNNQNLSDTNNSNQQSGTNPGKPSTGGGGGANVDSSSDGGHTPSKPKVDTSGDSADDHIDEPD